MFILSFCRIKTINLWKGIIKCMKTILCHTYYQLILSIQLKLTLFKNEPVQLYLVDTAGMTAQKVFRNLKRTHVFKECCFLRVQDFIQSESALSKVKDIVKMISGNNNYFEKLHSSDEIIFHNQNIIAYFLFSCLYEINPNVKVSRMEEGLTSYRKGDEPFFKSTVSEKIRKLFGKKSLQDKYNNYYCVFPELYKGKLNPVQIPQLRKEDETLKKILLEIFEVDMEKISINYPEKYIFFSSIFDQGKYAIKEEYVIKKIEEKVGHQNLKVKVHPRVNKEKYQKLGVNIDCYSGIPWEVIQLCMDFSQKVFLTVASGSVLSLNCFLENPPKTIFLFDICNVSHNEDATKLIYELKSVVYNPMYRDRFFYVANEAETEQWLLKS